MEQKGCCKKCLLSPADPNKGIYQAWCKDASCPCHTFQNSGNWEERYDELLKTFNIENRKPTEYEVSVESAVKQFLRLEIDRAERRVRDELREKITAWWTDFDGQCEGEACRLYRKILNLL